MVYSVPGPFLLAPGVPPYDPGHHLGATVQLDGDELLSIPHLMTLQIVAAPPTQEPAHRETVGDRWFDDGPPRLWAILTRTEPPDAVADLVKVRRRPPVLELPARIPFEPN